MIFLYQTNSGYTRQTWIDERLKWDPDDHDGIKKTRVHASDVWKPNIILDNADDGEFKSYIQGKLVKKVSLGTTVPNFSETRVVISANGLVEWLPPALFRSSCSMDVSLFPFDQQKCSLVFRSSTYDKRDLLFKKGCDDGESQ